MHLLARENKKIKLNKIDLLLLFIFICLVIYVMVLTNQTNNPMDLANILNNFDPTTGNGNSGIGGGGQNPTPGSEASGLGHNPSCNADPESNSEFSFQSNNKTFQEAKLQDNMVAQQHMTQDNMIAQQHMTQDNVVAQQHNIQGMTSNKEVWKQHGGESWVSDLLSSAAKTRTPSKKIQSFRRCRYADREKKGYKWHKK